MPLRAKRWVRGRRPSDQSSRVRMIFRSDLGGHLKTGHTWPLQNRPTKLSQDKSIYNPPMAISANIFCNPARTAYTGETWTEDTARQGCDQSADPGPEWRAVQAAPPGSHSGLGTASPSKESFFPYDAGA